MTDIQRVMINGRWPLMLPKHRAERESWPYWEATRLAAMHHHIRPGDVVYDVGAEAGDFGALFATWGAEVVLIEPNPKAWPTIRAVWEANDLEPPSQFAGFLAESALVGSLHGICLGGRWIAPAHDVMEEAHGFYYIGQHQAATMRLDDLSYELGVLSYELGVLSYELGVPDVVTIDVEGGEGHVLRGAYETLRNHKPAVFVSVHPQFMADLYGEHPNQIHDLMGDLGYHGRFLCEDHEQHWVWTHPDSGRMFPGVAPRGEYYVPGDRIVL